MVSYSTNVYLLYRAVDKVLLSMHSVSKKYETENKIVNKLW